MRNDFIFAGMGEEIGLFGLSALLICYLLIVERGLRAALGVRDSFGKLVAGGLAFTLGLQVFVILGGITRADPADRSDHAVPVRRRLVADGELAAHRDAAADLRRRPQTRDRRVPAPASGGPKQPPAQLHGAMTEVIKP